MKILEARFLRQVIALAQIQGWKPYHTHDSRRSEPGFPDLVLVRGDRIIFAELKRDGGKATLEQLQWLCALNGCETVSKLWWPRDWTEIERALAKEP